MPVKGIDFSGIKTTGNRGYNPEYIAYINEALRNGGMGAMQRAAVLANIIEESGGNPFAKDATGNFYGLLQWSNGRYAPTAEKDVYREIDNQVKTILDTAGNSTDRMSWTHGGKGSGYNSLFDAMAAFNDTEDLNKVMRGYTLGYVRPAAGVTAYNNRQKVADQIYGLKGFSFDAGGLLSRLKSVYGDANKIRTVLGKYHKYDGKSESTGQMMRTDEDGNIIDSINPAVYSLRDITGLKRKDIKRLAELDALSGEGMPALDTGTGWRKRVYGRRFEKTVAEAAKQQEKQALFNAAVDELRSGKPTGAFKELTKGGIESAAPLAMGIVGAAAAPVLLEGAASAYAIPQVKTALDVAGSIDGVRNLVSGNGIRKTIGYINDGNYGRAALSGLGDVFDLAGGIGLLKDVGRAVQGTRSYQKAKKLYDMGNGHNVNLFSVEPWRDAARQYATKTKSFTQEEKARIHERVKRAEASRTNERLFGDSYKEVFKKHATTPELKKMFKENPEYLYFVEKTGLDPLAQETIDAFGMQQNRSIRGVYLKKATKENVDKAMTEFNPQRANSGGDRLNSGGGVYSSNSGELADKFQRPTSDVITDNVVSELQYPYVRVKGTPREQLKALREQVLNRDDWFSDSNALLHQLPPQRKYRFLESEYTRRNGDVVSGAFERVTTKPQDVQSITSTYSHGLQDLKGRWGLNGVSTRPEDARLFIPKVTTRADLRKIISEGKQTIYKDLMDDYLLNIQKQQSRRRSLIENSLPYKVGNHVYDNTAIIGNKEVYSPLFITGSVAGGAGLLTGTILGGNQVVKEAQERNERDLRQFKKSELYKKFVESSGGPENFLRYLKEFKANKKKKDKKD